MKECGILVAADMWPSNWRLPSRRYLGSWRMTYLWLGRLGRYGSADDCQLTVNLVEPKRERRIAGLATGGCLYNLGVIAPMMYVFMCSEKRPLVGDLVRIDGERTTKRPPRSKGEVTTGGCWRMAHYSYVWSPKPSAAAVIHMG